MAFCAPVTAPVGVPLASRSKRPPANSSERFFERARADPIDLGAETQCGANGVKVGIDQARDDGPPARIDDARRGPCKFPDISRRPHGDDATVADGDGFLGGRSRVKRDDLAVYQNCVRGLRPGWSSQAQKNRGQVKGSHAAHCTRRV